MIDRELQAKTEEGKRFVAMAEEHAADFATRAGEHDRDASFPHENVEALQKSGFLAAPVPVEFGGMGVRSVHDLVVGMSRLGRGCASTAIAANMHIAVVRESARIWETREAAKAPPELTGPVQMILQAVAARQLIACAPNTEAGTDLNAPMTEAKRDGDMYVINGRKMFGTLSPAANLMFVSLRIERDGAYDRGLAIIPKGTPGATVMDNWDAMGMRASGSHDIVFENCRVPVGSVVSQGGWGELDDAFLEQAASVNFSLIATFLGMAESARGIAIEMVSTRRKGPRKLLFAERPGIQHLIAENEIDLATARAVTERAATLADEFFAARTAERRSSDVRELMKDQQCMKWVVQRKTIDIVDRAMTMSGGAGYMAKNSLARLYRDVRAGPFMQPFAPHEALEYIAKVTLGIEPPVDR